MSVIVATASSYTEGPLGSGPDGGLGSDLLRRRCCQLVRHVLLVNSNRISCFGGFAF